ncbi:Transferrin-like 3 [Homarus americanus]|uniref:Transferrin-like 3 n=1 Tax=Homarus americanus TaxID=6706 RepID=A0A8J5MJW0_HOMAM|nr:Transferrin-like 3 [Homarus americanus]
MYPCITQYTMYPPTVKLCVTPKIQPACETYSEDQASASINLVCVQGRDRYDCLHKIMKKEADLLPTQPEDVSPPGALLEKGEIKMDCNQTRTVVEHDLRAISNYFGQACILEIGSLITRRISSSVIADNYGLLCPDGRVENLDSTKPCHWAARPWNSWVARTTHDIQINKKEVAVLSKVMELAVLTSQSGDVTLRPWANGLLRLNTPSVLHVRQPHVTPVIFLRTEFGLFPVLSEVYGQLDASYFAVAVVKADSSITSSVNSKASPVILGLKNSRWSLLVCTGESAVQDSATELVNVREDEFHKTLGSSYYRAPY